MESDYIKREDAIIHITRYLCDEALKIGAKPHEQEVFDYIRKTINDIPAADVVEVVRCKYCKHKPHTKESDGDGYGFDITADGDFTCPFLCDDGYYNRMPSDDFYCSYGERKEQAHES